MHWLGTNPEWPDLNDWATSGLICKDPYPSVGQLLLFDMVVVMFILFLGEKERESPSVKALSYPLLILYLFIIFLLV